MSRKPLAALLSFALLFTLTALAKDRAVASAKPGRPPVTIGSGASVTGEVTSVSGNLITLAAGLVTIDATNARILHGDGSATIAAIQPGALIIATLQETDTVPAGPLTATAIAILRNADVTFTGTTQSVDVAGSQFILLGRTIKVDAGTTFVNFGDQASISALQANMLVVVEADVVAGALVAKRITLISPIPPRPHVVSGVVRSIGSEAWVITVDGHDTTFVVNASTKVLGSPKAGDKVEVLYTVDTAHANVALSIIKSIEVPKIAKFTGVVKSIDGRHWVITRDDDHKDVAVHWPESVPIFPFAKVGDHVEVLAIEQTDGTYTAILIVPRR
jgi:hypothetical protein